MVTKEEIFGGQGRLRGIQETVRRRTQEFQDEQIEEAQREQELANQYYEKLKQGEIQNINQIPDNIRKYFNLEEILEKTKSSIKEEIKKAQQKQQEIEADYNSRVERLREWYKNARKKAGSSSERSQIRKDYESELVDLREDYRPDIVYYRKLSNELGQQVNQIDRGEILTKEYALEVSKAEADYDKRREQAQWDKKQAEVKQEQVSGYVERINKGEIKLKDVPQNIRRYIATEPKKEGFTGFVTKYDGDVPVETEIIRNWETVGKVPGVDLRTTVKKPEFDIDRIKQDSQVLKDIRQRQIKETERYQDLGYSKSQAEILAEQSLKEGGMTYIPPKAEEIIVNKRVEENINKLNQDIKNSFKNIFKVGEGKELIELYSPKTARETLDLINNFANSVLNRLSYAFEIEEAKQTEYQLKQLEKRLSMEETNFTKKLNELGLSEIPKDSEIQEIKNKLEQTKENLKLGISSLESQLKTLALDVALDFVIPPKAYADIGLLLNQIIPREEDLVKVSESIQKEGTAETFNNLKSGAWEKIENFITNKEELKEIENLKKQYTEEIKEVREGINKGEYDKVEANRYINNLNAELNNLKTYEKSLNSNSLLTIGTVGFLAANLGLAVATKLRNKKVFRNFNQAEEAAKRFNKLEANKPIREIEPFIKDTYSGLKLTPNELKYIENQLKIKGKGIEDIEYAQISVNSKEIQGPAFVRKISKELKFKPSIMEKIKKRIKKTPKVEYYVMDTRPNFYQNTVDITIRAKDGRTLGFSLISKSNKNLAKLLSLEKNKQVLNALKYGTNKRYIVSERLGETDIVGATQFRRRAGVSRPEEYWLGRERTKEITEIKRSPKVLERLRKDRDKILKMDDKQLEKLSKEIDIPIEEILQRVRLSPEEIWGLAQPVAVTQTRTLRDAQRDRASITPRGIFEFAQRREVGVQRVGKNDLKLDLSTFNYISRNIIDNIKSLPKSKRTKSEENIIKISEKVDEAIKKGKNTVTIKNKELKNINTKDFAVIQQSISSQIIPSRVYNNLTTKAKNNLKTVTSKVKSIEKNVSSSASKINRLDSQISSKYWEGISKDELTKLNSQISSAQRELTSSQNTIKSQISKLESNIDTLSQELSKVTDVSQAQQLQQLVQQQSVMKSQAQQLNSQITSLNSAIKNISTNLTRIRRIKLPGLKIPKGKTEKEVKLKKEEYGIFSRTYGKDFLVKKAKTKKKAKDILENTLENTLRASGFIKKGNKRLKGIDLGKDFTKSKRDPWRIVEKRSSRLDTIGEKRELKRAKEKAKKRKVKTAEEYWLG